MSIAETYGELPPRCKIAQEYSSIKFNWIMNVGMLIPITKEAARELEEKNKLAKEEHAKVYEIVKEHAEVCNACLEIVDANMKREEEIRDKG